jgi:hypothetical protein
MSQPKTDKNDKTDTDEKKPLKKNPEHGDPAKKDAPNDSPKQMKSEPAGDYPTEPERDEEEGLDEDEHDVDENERIEKNAGAESADDADEEETETEENEQGDERHPQEPQPSHP